LQKWEPDGAIVWPAGHSHREFANASRFFAEPPTDDLTRGTGDIARSHRRFLCFGPVFHNEKNHSSTAGDSMTG
jgi:hypothetical protein